MRRVGRVLFAVVASTCAFGAAAADGAQLNGCTGSGRVFIDAVGTGSTVTNWRVDGVGSCPVQTTPTAPITAREPTTVSFTGAGTSDTLGLCDNTLLVRNFNLAVNVSYRGAVTGTTVVEHQRWSAPATTFPLATVFLITGDGGPPALGAGIAVTHIFLQCGNGGNSPSVNFAWAESP
jgi:hypothetical protein